MARVVIVLAILGALIASMVAISQKPKLGATEAIAGPTATVPLAPKAADEDLAADSDTHSVTAVDPRAVTNSDGQAAPASAQDVADGPIAGAAPSIGTAGMDHKGRASFTGTASPGDAVSLVWDGKAIANTNADASGNWTINVVAPKSTADQRVYVASQGKGGSVVIGPQRALVRPPVTDGGLPRITLKAADQSAKTLQEGNVSDAQVTTGLIVEKITTGESGAIVLTGRADPSATVKAAINGKAAGETKVAADGGWTLTATNPSRKAAKSVRLDLVNKEGVAIDGSDLPYKVDAPTTRVAANETQTHADVTPASTALTEPKAAVAAEAPKYRTIKVRRGDSLWRISKRHLGNGKRWAKFYRLNKKKIDNPDMIYPGQTLILPG